MSNTKNCREKYSRHAKRTRVTKPMLQNTCVARPMCWRAEERCESDQDTNKQTKTQNMSCRGYSKPQIARKAIRNNAPESYEVSLNFWHATHWRRMNISFVHNFKIARAHTNSQKRISALKKEKQ